MSCENTVNEPSIVEVGKKLEGTDVDYYNDAAKYWEKVDSTVNGMLGGFGKISEIDIEASNKLLKFLFKVRLWNTILSIIRFWIFFSLLLQIAFNVIFRWKVVQAIAKPWTVELELAG